MGRSRRLHSANHDQRLADPAVVPVWYSVLLQGQDVPPLVEEQQRAPLVTVMVTVELICGEWLD